MTSNSKIDKPAQGPEKIPPAGAAEGQKESPINAESALRYSGILVTALVGGVASWTVSELSIFPLVAALALAQFLLLIFHINQETPAGVNWIFWAQSVLISALMFLVPDSFIYILTVVWVVEAVELFGPRKASWLLVGTLVVFASAQLRYSGLDGIIGILITTAMYALFNMFAIAVTQRFIGEREQKEITAALNRELIATRDLLSQSAAQGERLRIARDLHDILGHHMTALILNLEIANHSIEGKPKEKVSQSLAIAKMLLGDLRSTVSELRDDAAINLEESIKKLVTGIPNFDIEVDFTEAPNIQNMDIAETLLRCTQEAITNVLRHSDADHCRIVMTGDDASYTLSVIDNGTGASSINPGNGLTGMQERVSARGGRLNWQRSDQGFELEVTMGAKAAL